MPEGTEAMSFPWMDSRIWAVFEPNKCINWHIHTLIASGRVIDPPRKECKSQAVAAYT
jgi:hypothetical protein